MVHVRPRRGGDERDCIFTNLFTCLSLESDNLEFQNLRKLDEIAEVVLIPRVRIVRQVIMACAANTLNGPNIVEIKKIEIIIVSYCQLYLVTW